MDAVRALIVAFTITVVVILGGSVISSLVDSTGESIDGDQITHQAATFEGDENYVRLNDGQGRDETVYKTTGYAVNLSGAADSYVRSSAEFDVAGADNWTVSVWAYADQSSPPDMAAVSANGRVTISLDRSAGQWRGWYYDDGSRDSYLVNVSTSGNEVGAFTNVMVWHNGTHLSIYRNGTQGEIKDVTGDSIQSAPVSATNWDGRLEELRTFDSPLDASQRTSVVNSPVEQLPNASPSARAMFDQPNRDTQLLLYTDTHLEQSNVAFSSGFGEQVMDGPGNLIGSDYRWDNVGPSVAPISSSELGGAPVAYVSYRYSSGGVADVADGWLSFSQLAETILIIIGLTILMSYLAKLRG